MPISQKDILSTFLTNPSAFEFAPEELRGDKDFVLAAVAQNGLAFKFASQKLKGDKDFVLAAIEKSSSAFIYASQELKKDKDFVLKMANQIVQKARRDLGKLIPDKSPHNPKVDGVLFRDYRR